jgi:phytoene dehydrogenase-like protein
VCSVITSLLSEPAPPLDELGASDAWNLLRTARRFRALERTDAYRLLRWVPMPVADLSAEWFECDVVRAIVAARGVSGVSFGPRSAGSGLVMLLREAARLSAGHTSQVRGGPGVLTAAMAAAARAAGAEIRTGARVEQIVSGTGGVTGVVADGQELPADAVVSAIDPKTTLLHLTDPAALPPDVLAKMRAYRSAGTMAKVNLALSALPVFSGLPPGATEPLTGTIHLGPGLDYLERAFDHVKYGEMSADPWFDVTIPSIRDPGLAPAGAHVMSVYVHHAPYRLREGTWDSERANLLQRTLGTLSRFSSGIEKLVVAAEAITPMDLEARHGFNGGHIFHGELTLDQLATMRPILGYARYESPLRGLFLCSAGTHPGGFMSGASGKMAAREVRRTLKA